MWQWEYHFAIVLGLIQSQKLNNKFDFVKEKNRRRFSKIAIGRVVLFPIPSFKLPVCAHNEVNWHKSIASAASGIWLTLRQYFLSEMW